MKWGWIVLLLLAAGCGQQGSSEAMTDEEQATPAAEAGLDRDEMAVWRTQAELDAEEQIDQTNAQKELDLLEKEIGADQP